MRSALYAVVLFFAASAGHAATVTYSLDLRTSGQWGLYASTSSGDNAGLAGYGIVLVGSPSSLSHQSVRGFDDVSSASIGFTIARSTNGIAALTISGFQDNILPTPFLVKGWGQVSGSVSTLFPTVTPTGLIGGTWTQLPAPGEGFLFPNTPIGALIASGNIPDQNKATFTFAQPSAQLLGNVFSGASSFVNSAQVQTRVLRVIPEPSSIALFGLSVLSAVRMRRELGSLSHVA